MSIATEITRLQNVRADILQAIANKGVTVPEGTVFSGVADLIASIPTGGAVSVSIANVMPTTGVKVVDGTGYVGFDLAGSFYPSTSTCNYSNNFVVKVDGADFSASGLGQVTLVDTSVTIGGRVYPTVTIGGVTWLAENLDLKDDGITIGTGASSDSTPLANYYDNDEATYGASGNKYGLLYNGPAMYYLESHKSTLFPGWHVSLAEEWDALATYVGGADTAGVPLKSKTGWDSDGNGADDFGFGACPGGSYSEGFYNVGSYGFYWTADDNGSMPFRRYFDTYGSMGSDAFFMEGGHSIRLVKDSE